MAMAHIRSAVTRQCGLAWGFGKMSEAGAARFVVHVLRTHMVPVVKLPVHGLHALGLEEFEAFQAAAFDLLDGFASGSLG